MLRALLGDEVDETACAYVAGAEVLAGGMVAVAVAFVVGERLTGTA